MAVVPAATIRLQMDDLSDLLRQQRNIEELLKSVAPEVIGPRLGRIRQRLGMSVRDLAAAAGVNKNSVIRLEKGGAPLPLTVLKICAAMGVHVATIANPEHSDGEIVAIHRSQDDRWYDLADLSSGPVADRPLEESERRKLAEAGLESPMLMLKGRLETGQLIPNVIELYGQSERRSHMGEEMVYVLKGTARITVGPQSFDLAEGECATFWSSEEHFYAPAEGADLPVRVLSVTNHRGPARS
jgi:transcriptional regulator with XRE-family HTH domain